jgi:hypothetical protein
VTVGSCGYALPVLGGTQDRCGWGADLLLLADDDGKIFGTKVLCNKHLDGLVPRPLRCSSKAHGEMQQGGSRVAQEPIDLGRSRKVRFGRIARKPAPMLVLDRLTVKMTVKVREAVASTLQINDLDGSLTIEWE